jgi:hypothetical protein
MYADRNVCKCLYVGTEQQYQEYRKLVQQQSMADEAAVAAEESRPEGNWGLSGLWP